MRTLVLLKELKLRSHDFISDNKAAVLYTKKICRTPLDQRRLSQRLQEV